MNSRELESLLAKALPAHVKFYGVCARDQLFTIEMFPACCVTNTDVVRSDGIHWVAFYFASPSCIEFFDSFGLSPAYYGLNIARSLHCVNSRQLQSDYSSTCGHWCIYFLVARASVRNSTHLFKRFSATNFAANDRHVRQFVSRLNK